MRTPPGNGFSWDLEITSHHVRGQISPYGKVEKKYFQKLAGIILPRAGGLTHSQYFPLDLKEISGPNCKYLLTTAMCRHRGDF